MSERYNVAAEDVLGENYKITNIEASDYNPTIDDNITVTITVTDVYEDPIEGENVTVTATEGTFTQLNGSDITASDSVTGTTNSSGQFTLTYTCTEWGLITFVANTTSTQIRVTGFKQITVNTYCTLYVNGSERICEFRYYQTDVSFPSLADKTITTNLIPTEYRPVANGVAVSIYNPKLGGLIEGASGTFSVSPIETGNKTVNAHATWTY